MSHELSQENPSLEKIINKKFTLPRQNPCTKQHVSVFACYNINNYHYDNNYVHLGHNCVHFDINDVILQPIQNQLNFNLGYSVVLY